MRLECITSHLPESCLVDLESRKVLPIASYRPYAVLESNLLHPRVSRLLLVPILRVEVLSYIATPQSIDGGKHEDHVLAWRS